MERKIVFRHAVPEDIAVLLAVQQAAPGAASWTADDYGSVLGDEGIVCLLAEDAAGEQAAGFLLGRILADELEILNLAVIPEWRRRGVGRRLLGEALAQARQRGVRTCWLEVRAANQAARQFYRVLGFAENGRRRRYYCGPEDDAVVCVRTLAAAGPAP